MQFCVAKQRQWIYQFYVYSLLQMTIFEKKKSAAHHIRKMVCYWSVYCEFNLVEERVHSKIKPRSPQHSQKLRKSLDVIFDDLKSSPGLDLLTHAPTSGTIVTSHGVCRDLAVSQAYPEYEDS